MAAIALIFDFDDTLVPDSTSALIESRGIDAADFWTNRTSALVRQGYDPALAYLNLLLQEVGPGRPLGQLSNAELAEFGESMDEHWYPGLPEMFDELLGEVGPHRDVTLEFYIISGGLEALIGGSKIVQKYFSGWYGSQFGEDENGVVRDIKRCITFTEKTRYLFEISKGIPMQESRTKPHLVNEKREQRRIPLNQMIYVGDGLTDIPCFSLVTGNDGDAFGVFEPGRPSAKQRFQQLLKTDRVKGLYPPEYGGTDTLGAIIRLAISTLAAKDELQSGMALS